VLLSAGEHELLREYAVPVAARGLTVVGTLYLTDQRLFLEEVKRRLLSSPHVSTFFDLPLPLITNASIRVRLRRAVALEIEAGHSRYELRVVDPPRWSKALAEAKVAHVPHGARPGNAPEAVATHTIERHVVKVRCRHCGTLSNELLAKCPSCGAPL
jgi:hypothetical protein